MHYAGDGINKLDKSTGMAFLMNNPHLVWLTAMIHGKVMLFCGKVLATILSNQTRVLVVGFQVNQRGPKTGRKKQETFGVIKLAALQC